MALSGTGYCAAFNTRKTARAVTSLYDAVLRESGIRSTQFAILIGIAKSGSVSIGELAETLLLDHTTLTRSLHLMRRAGWLTVSGRASFRRRFVKLLPKGERQLARSIGYWRRVQRAFISEIGEETWRSAQQTLERLATRATAMQDLAWLRAEKTC